MNANYPTPEKALKIVRILWAAMLGAPVVLLIVLTTLLAAGPVRPKPEMNQVLDVLFYINVAMLLIGVPLAYFVRMSIYKKNWQGNIITPPGYCTGNLMLFAICDSVVLFSLMVTFLAGRFGLPLVVGVIAMAVIAVNVPTGNPLRPSEPDFGVHER